MINHQLCASSGSRLRLAAALFCMLLCLLPGLLSGAEKRPRKIVRIAYQEFNRQMIVDEHNKPVSGYAYDYIQTVAAYAGWNVDFVPCSSFADSVRLLRAGKVDLIYEISPTPERAKEMLFPSEPMGYEYYYLYTTERNTSIATGDYDSMNGKKAGVTKGTILPELLKQWCKKKNVRLEIIEYEDISAKEADLRAGRIDLDLEVSTLAKHDLSAVEKIGADAYYLVAKNDRPDLIADINSAVEKVLNNDLFYFSRLQERYFSETVLSRNLTREEKEWLANHKVLRVGYLDDYLPFCAKNEKGEAIGSAIDAVNEIRKHLNLEDKLKVEFICFDSQREGYLALASGKIDVMLPAYISNSVKKDYGIIGGKPFAALASDVAYVKENRGKRIGVNRNNLMQYYYTRDSYPKAQIVFYDDIHGCLDGLLNGTSDVTFLNGFRSKALLKPNKYHSLKIMRAKSDFKLCMAFAKDNLGLMLLMNRGLTLLDPDFVNNASYTYLERIYSFSFMDFLQEHILSVIVTVAILVALLAALLVYGISNRKLSVINRELLDYSETIAKQNLQESELRKQLEKKQLDLEDALQMAQAASHAKTTFLSNMSHDIRTPMNAIVGFTGLAANHIDDKERVKEYLATIAQSSEHLLSLINDVLDMSRIESGKMTLNEKEESLSEILRALRDIVDADIQAKRHRFIIDAVNIRNEFVYCDKMRLNQVLLNLVSNAIKYTHPGGTISLRLTQKAVTDTGYGAFEFRCRDNGIGMSEEFVKTIFEPFTREANSTVSGIEGTGLGMAITKNIVDMMGGRISVVSKKGEGTEFTVAVDFRLADRPVADRAIPELEGLRCLVVDDDVHACQNIADMLRDLGMRGEWCASGSEAVVRTEESLRHGDGFKVYIVDGRMPDANGLETVRRIREAASDGSVIIMTAYDWGDIEKEAREAGVTEFVSKPLFPSDLRKALSQACGKGGSARANRQKNALSFKGRKVLMVDDSKLNLKIGVLLLQEQGMVVDTAPNGKVAVDMIREKGVDAYDFVLMDVQMPVMDGYETTGVIRKLPGGDKLKIIAFSANAFEEDREKSLAAGMDGHIAKPLKIDELLNELKRFVG